MYQVSYKKYFKFCRKNKHEKISHEEDRYPKLKLDVRQKMEQDEISEELKPNDTSIIVHPEIHIPATIYDIHTEHKKEINEGKRSMAMNTINPQIKLGKVEARVFLREIRPKLYHSEEQQRPQMSSDSESRMIVGGEDPKLYYTDSECVTSHGKQYQRVKFISFINYFSSTFLCSFFFQKILIVI